jgi:mRNA interferase RelE/StbE
MAGLTDYKILYSETVREQIRFLHPRIKPDIKSGLENIRDNPYIGKRLQKELSGYFSFRIKRFRIVYKINDTERSVEIHHIGHRKNIYEIVREQKKKSEKDRNHNYPDETNP